MNDQNHKESDPSLMAELKELLKSRKERAKSKHITKTWHVLPGTTVMFDSESAGDDIKGFTNGIKNAIVGSYRATKNAGRGFKQGFVDGYKSQPDT